VSAQRQASVGAVELRNVRKDYGDSTAVDGVDLELDRAERVALVGPNGSGKTTLLRMVVGLLEPTAGEIRILGARACSLEARSVTAYIPDQPVLYDDLSVLEHLEYVARLHGMGSWEARAEELVERLGLSERVDDLPARFSRGLRQKTGIALALVRPFELLVVDEPFVGLDGAGREALLTLLDEVAEAGRTVVVATHQPDFLSRADRCVGLRDGSLAYDGPASGQGVVELMG
jgi:ABC-type multidrug transport system ATPase subunit